MTTRPHPPLNSTPNNLINLTFTRICLPPVMFTIKAYPPVHPSVHPPHPHPHSRPTQPTLTDTHTSITSPLTPQISPDRPLQPPRPLPNDLRQILQVISSGNTKAANKVLGRRLEVAVVLATHTTTAAAHAALILLVAAKVGVAGNGLGALEALQARLGFGLRAGLEHALAEELVRGDGLLRAELLARVVLAVVYCSC